MLNFTDFLGEKLTLRYHNHLNQLLFDDDKLKPDVRVSLIKIAREWQRFAKIPEELLKDVIFTGGNCQYNYTKFSDIDLHLVINRSGLFDNKTYVDEYLDDKKKLWALSRNVRVKGYSVELYAQDEGDKLIAAGVYSLKENKWLRKPIHGKYDFKHDEALEKKVEDLEKTIDSMIEDGVEFEKFKIMKDKLKQMRNAALASGDEFSFENCVFKELRNRGVLGRMNKYLQTVRDKSLSLE